MAVAEKSPAPLPAKLAGLVREAKWLVLVALAAYLLLILVTYNRADPGWSHSGAGEGVRNAGGVVGAWIADLALYLFGLSAYWWLALCVYVVVWGTRRLEPSRLGLAVAAGRRLLRRRRARGLRADGKERHRSQAQAEGRHARENPTHVHVVITVMSPEQ